MNDLHEDILPNVSAMAAYLYGRDDKTAVRRVRHLIEHHGLPVKRVGARIESRKSWLDRYYAEPDRPRTAA